MTGPNPAMSGPYADPAPLNRVQQFDAAVNATVRAAAREAVLAMPNVTAAPSEVHSPGVLVVDVAGVRRDVIVDATPRAHRPPGWASPARYGPGDIIAVSGQHFTERTYWQVLDVLGTVDDPRPGYRLTSVGRDERGGFDAGLGDGRTIVELPDVEARSTREQGGAL